MKRIFPIFLIIPLIIVSCESVPHAAFFVDNDEPEVGQEVYFTNDSFNSERYEWDFGDGTYSHEEHPVHVYTGSGVYEVILTAYSRTGLSDEAYMTLVVSIPTLLEVEVLEYYDLYPVDGASVTLYPTLADWDAERNMITEGITDADGKVVFTGLGSHIYYLDIWETNHNNYTLRDEDVDFIRTQQLKLHQINRFVAYVDYTGTKGSNIRDRSVKIKRLERKAE
jgi:PKD repeat protein